MEKVITAVLGSAVALIGLFIVVWGGFWWGFIGGIVDIVEAIQGDETVAIDLAWGAAKVVLLSHLIAGAGAMVTMMGGGIVQSIYKKGNSDV